MRGRGTSNLLDVNIQVLNREYICKPCLLCGGHDDEKFPIQLTSIGDRLREAVAHGGSTVDFIVQSTFPEHSFTGGNSSKGSGFLFLICFPYKGVNGVVTFDG